MLRRKPETHSNGAITGLESARRYAEIAQRSRARFRSFLRQVESLGIPGNYLDVGAGPGIQAALVARSNPGVQITALEISRDMVGVGREYVEREGLQDQIRYVIGDGADAEVVSELGTFDLVYSVHSLHHWDDPRRVIGNCLSVTTEEGTLLIHDLRRVWWLYWVPIHNGLLDSIRAAYVDTELRSMLDDIPAISYEVRKDRPFMHSAIIRRRL